MKSLFLLLGFGWLSIWASPSKAETRWTTYLRPSGSPAVFGGVGILPSPLITDPAIRACWAPFRPLPGCSMSLFHAASSNKLDLSPACCNAVLRLSPECFDKIFATDPFKRGSGLALKSYCASQHLSGSQPAPAPAVK